MDNFKKQLTVFFAALLIAAFSISCSEEDNGVAPYVGSPDMSTIVVEAESFQPKITWVGGYASVLGVNKGTRAILDSSLVWLIKTDGNNLRYPVKFGTLPSGANDLTAQFGGTVIDSLNEDEDYTFWVMQQEGWDKLSSETGKVFIADTNLAEGQIVSELDSVYVSTSFFTGISKRLDVFINIEGLSSFGQLGIISVEATRSNRPIINWEITQEGVEDTLISVIGICEGNQYNPGTTIWEVYSESEENGNTVYGAANVIKAPLNVGDSLAQTMAFVPFDMEGLERNKTYYIWIANNLWGGEGRLRFEPGYAYAIFNVR